MRKKPKSIEEAREWLRDTADFLAMPPPPIKGRIFPVSPQHQFVAAAIYDYLDGKYPSVDRALGLTLGPGRLRADSATSPVYEKVRQAIRLLWAGKSWKEIYRELNIPPENERSFKRSVKLYLPAVVEDLARELLDSPNGEGP